MSQLGFTSNPFENNKLGVKELNDGKKVKIEGKEVLDALDFGKLLNDSKHYITYKGSLTSPPCSNNVQWFVLLKKLGVSRKQVRMFKVMFGKSTNIRGLQKMNGRKLLII